MRELIDRLAREHTLTSREFAALIAGRDQALDGYLFQRAAEVRQEIFGNRVYLRGLIEFTNYCKNDCYYCGIRRSNREAQRYRLTEEEILSCCREGYDLGFRTFVLQGGEDPYFTTGRMCALVGEIKAQFPDCAVTLSIGERSGEDYQAMFDAGADRYLLRHETANDNHYHTLHPPSMSPENRKRCLRDLKDIGYQVGCGMMVGSPGQTPAHLAEDMLFIRALEPQMVGIGPFIPQHSTPFANQRAGTLELTLFLLGLLRLMQPKALLPATTALGTVHPRGRELGILAGANVCMPNLSPAAVRAKYALYDNKLCTGDESAQGVRDLKARLAAIGYEAVVGRGDHPDFSLI